MENSLDLIDKNSSCALYLSKVDSSPLVKSYVLSTPESRAICNDPFVTGMSYTQKLSAACVKALKILQLKELIILAEDDTTVLHILRGGLNYGLRDALHQAFGWNNHASAFISAQRARKSPNSEDWIITESSYKKIYLKKRNNIVLGDVVATGTSLEFALQRLKDAAAENPEISISSLVFFTIGGPRSHQIIERISAELKKAFPGYTGSTVVYLEGIFAVATPQTAMSIKYDGTDLLRTASTLTPEFIESQYESASYPLERCTIYDAGSRAFDTNEYFHDIEDYWSKTLALAEKGTTFSALLKERFPELQADRFKQVDLKELCRQQLGKLPDRSNAVLREKGE
jgi:hypoxanthine-guanine phosphoribosyltransferase